MVDEQSQSSHDSSLVALLQSGQLFGTQELGMGLSDQQLRSLSPVALAYIGDAVYELFVRRALLMPPKRIQTYHRQVVEQVRAEQQSLYLQQLMPLLTDAEQEILRRGRNASPRGPKRLDAKTYQQATSFEALLGYLYLTNLERLADLLARIDLIPSRDGCSN